MYNDIDDIRDKREVFYASNNDQLIIQKMMEIIGGQKSQREREIVLNYAKKVCAEYDAQMLTQEKKAM